MFVWRFCRGWRQFSSLFQFSCQCVLTRSASISACFLKFFVFSTSHWSVRLLNYLFRVFLENFLIRPVPEIFLCFAVSCAAFRCWTLRSVYSFYTLYTIYILCPRYFLWFSALPDICGNFPGISGVCTASASFCRPRFSFAAVSIFTFNAAFLVYPAVK